MRDRCSGPGRYRAARAIVRVLRTGLLGTGLDRGRRPLDAGIRPLAVRCRRLLVVGRALGGSRPVRERSRRHERLRARTALPRRAGLACGVVRLIGGLALPLSRTRLGGPLSGGLLVAPGLLGDLAGLLPVDLRPVLGRLATGRRRPLGDLGGFGGPSGRSVEPGRLLGRPLEVVLPLAAPLAGGEANSGPSAPEPSMTPAGLAGPSVPATSADSEPGPTCAVGARALGRHLAAAPGLGRHPQAGARRWGGRPLRVRSRDQVGGNGDRRGQPAARPPAPRTAGRRCRAGRPGGRPRTGPCAARRTRRRWTGRPGAGSRPQLVVGHADAAVGDLHHDDPSDVRVGSCTTCESAARSSWRSPAARPAGGRGRSRRGRRSWPSAAPARRCAGTARPPTPRPAARRPPAPGHVALGQVGAREDQQVLAVAAHAGGEVVELEQVRQLVRVLLVALQLLDQLQLALDQRLAAAGEVDEHGADVRTAAPPARPRGAPPAPCTASNARATWPTSSRLLSGTGSTATSGASPAAHALDRLRQPALGDVERGGTQHAQRPDQAARDQHGDRDADAAGRASGERSSMPARLLAVALGRGAGRR